MSQQPYVLRSTFGPPNRPINDLYSESPILRDGICEVYRPESVQRLLNIGGFELVEDPIGNIDPSKKPMDPEEASKFLGVARTTVYKYIHNGKLSASKTDEGTWSISRASVEALADNS